MAAKNRRVCQTDRTKRATNNRGQAVCLLVKQSGRHGCGALDSLLATD